MRTKYCISAQSKDSSSVNVANELLEDTSVALVDQSYIIVVGTLSNENIRVLDACFHIDDDLSIPHELFEL